MKTRVEKFLIQVEMAEPTGEQPHQEGTVWTDEQRWRETVRSCASLWGTLLTRGPSPEVTITREH